MLRSCHTGILPSERKDSCRWLRVWIKDAAFHEWQYKQLCSWNLLYTWVYESWMPFIQLEIYRWTIINRCKIQTKRVTGRKNRKWLRMVWSFLLWFWVMLIIGKVNVSFGHYGSRQGRIRSISERMESGISKNT